MTSLVCLCQCLTRKFLQLCRASIIVKLALAIPVRWRVGRNVDQRGCGRLQGLPLVRLASFLAMELLIGYNVVCVRAEDLDISGSLRPQHVEVCRIQVKHDQFQSDACPLHFGAPCKLMWRTIRGMIPTRQHEAPPRWIVRSPTLTI